MFLAGGIDVSPYLCPIKVEEIQFGQNGLSCIMPIDE